MYQRFKQDLETEAGTAYAEAEAWQQAVCEIMKVKSLPFKYSATKPDEYVKAKIEATRIMLSFIATGATVLPSYMALPEPAAPKGGSDTKSEPVEERIPTGDPIGPVSMEHPGEPDANPDEIEEIDIGEPPQATPLTDAETEAIEPDPDSKEGGLRELPETDG